MSFIGKNIKKIRAVKKMSQSEFAQLFHLARPSIGAYEEGRTEPKIDTIIQMAKHFKLSIDILLTKELTINELYQFDIFKKEFAGQSHQVVDKDDVKEQTPLVALDNHLNYIVNHQNKDFVNHLPVIQFPFTKDKKSRAFQVSGHEMMVENQGIHHKDILLCLPISTQAMERGHIYVVVTAHQIVARRFHTLHEEYVFICDNTTFDQLSLKKEDILELWKADARFSAHLGMPTRLESRVSVLEEQVKVLLKKA